FEQFSGRSTHSIISGQCRERARSEAAARAARTACPYNFVVNTDRHEESLPFRGYQPLAGREGYSAGESPLGGLIGWADFVVAVEDGASPDGDGGRGDVAPDLGFGADKDGAASGDVPLDLAAHHHAAALDLVGDDHVPLLLHGDDAAGF